VRVWLLQVVRLEGFEQKEEESDEDETENGDLDGPRNLCGRRFLELDHPEGQFGEGRRGVA